MKLGNGSFLSLLFFFLSFLVFGVGMIIVAWGLFRADSYVFSQSKKKEATQCRYEWTRQSNENSSPGSSSGASHASRSYCLSVSLYPQNPDGSINWKTKIESAHIVPGQTIVVGVVGASSSGIIDKARFRFGPEEWKESTDVSPYGEYYIRYQVPQNASEFAVDAQVHHVTDGWE
jgi:hypothetical protein